MRFEINFDELITDEEFFSFEATTLSRKEFFEIALKLASSLSSAEGETLFINDKNLLSGMTKAFALAYRGSIPIFSTSHKDFAPDLKFTYLKDVFAKSEPYSLRENKIANIGFSTSGSSGEPKICLKTWDNLFAEVFELKKLLRLQPNEQIISFVPTFHIFGFLFGFLLPLVTEAKVRLGDPQSAFDLLGSSEEDAQILIMTPALWPSIKKCIGMKTRLIISSGAALPPHIENEFREIRGNSALSLVEVVGSSETGGLGYRVIEENAQKFKTFYGIKFCSENDAVTVDSPFIYRDLNPFTLSDKLEIEGEYFRYIGRTDRIFKYAGKRFSLDSIEKNLRTLMGDQTRCVFEANSAELKGGLLHCFNEGAPCESIVKIREAYISRFDTPFPDKFHFLKAFPKNQMGKICAEELLKVVRM